MHKKSINSNFILSQLKPFSGLILAQNIIFIFIALVDFRWKPSVLRNLVNEIYKSAKDGNYDNIVGYLIGYTSLSVLVTFFYRFSEYIWLKLNPTLKCFWGLNIIDKLLSQSAKILEKNFSGSLGNKIKDSMSALPDLLKLCGLVISGVFSVILSIITVYGVNYKFSILLCVWVVIFSVGSFSLLKKAKILSKNSAEVRSKIVGDIVDIFVNIVNIQLFTGKSREQIQLKGKFSKWIAIDQQRDWYFIKAWSFQGFLFIIYQSYCFFLLLEEFKNGTVTAGDFAMLTSVNVSVLRLLWFISEDIMKISDMKALVDQGLEIAMIPVSVVDRYDALDLNISGGKIEFENVDFKYANTDVKLFEKFSIEILPKQRVGIVGYSGVGKSTFINLILRLYDINGGSIKIDEQSVSDVKQDSIRQNISVVSQESILFHRSILENIQYGDPLATYDKIVEASKIVQIHDFITNLSQGYDTMVGQLGAGLSGGQRQRIAIARALVKNAPIFIMDEATSQLDSVTECAIQGALPMLMFGKTTLVIAHRLSTLKLMDRILVFDKGKIIQDGSHENLLLDKGGLYYKMWSAQVWGI